MCAEIRIFTDRAEEDLLFAAAELVVVGLVGDVDDFVGLGELAVGAAERMVEANRLGLRVRIDVGGFAGGSGGGGDDADAAARADDIFHEEGGLAHHRAPAGFIPADGAVGEGDLEVTVIDLARDDFLGEAGADAGDAHGAGTGHAAHHIDVMDAAVDDGRGGAEEIFMRLPIGAGALLVEVHPHHEGFAQSLRELGEFLPRWVDVEDVADDQRTLQATGGGDDAFALGEGDGDGFFEEDVGASFHRSDGIIGVRLGVGADADGVRFGAREGVGVVGEFGVAAIELEIEFLPGGRAAGDEPDDFEVVGHFVVGAGV